MTTITDQLRSIIDTGTEEEVRSFIGEHFNEFPEALRKEMAVALFRDSLKAEIREREAIIDLKKEAIKMMEAFEAAEKAQA